MIPRWKHQDAAFDFAKDKRAAMLAMDMGTGKSACLIDLLQYHGCRRVLIVCPKSVVRVWPQQFEKFHEDFAMVKALDRGSLKKRTDEAAKGLSLSIQMKIPFICIINYEAAHLLPFAAWAHTVAWDAIVLDESHRIKQPGGKASLWCYRMGKSAPRRYCLTGTPMPHSPLDLYAQYRFLDQSIFGKTFAGFKQRYAVTVQMPGFEKVVGYQNQDELHEKMYRIAYRVSADVLDLPPAQHEVRTFTLGAKAAKAYKDLSKEFVTWLEEQGAMASASNALVKLLRLAQLTSGFLRMENDQEAQVDDGKERLLADILDDLPLDEPVVVFARFRHDLDAIERVTRASGRTYRELSGRANQLAAWQEGDGHVLGVQIQAGGVGVDLTRARYCIYYSVGYSLGDYEQSLARVHRPGQERPVYYLHLVAAKTVDEEIYAALSAKKDVVESILRREAVSVRD